MGARHLRHGAERADIRLTLGVSEEGNRQRAVD